MPGWVEVCVRAALLIQHAKHTRHIVTSFVAPQAALNFSTLSHKGTHLGKNVI
jgi:hypothetical protein